MVSIALIRGRATGNGSEIALACDLTFVSREKAVLSQLRRAMGGGAPLSGEGKHVAGVGVSGGTVEQDVAILESALQGD